MNSTTDTTDTTFDLEGALQSTLRQISAEQDAADARERQEIERRTAEATHQLQADLAQAIPAHMLRALAPVTYHTDERGYHPYATVTIDGEEWTLHRLQRDLFALSSPRYGERVTFHTLADEQQARAFYAAIINYRYEVQREAEREAEREQARQQQEEQEQDRQERQDHPLKRRRHCTGIYGDHEHAVLATGYRVSVTVDAGISEGYSNTITYSGTVEDRGPDWLLLTDDDEQTTREQLLIPTHAIRTIRPLP